MKIIVVSLERDLERRMHIQLQLRALGLSFEIFSAIDGQQLSDKELLHLQNPSLKHPSGFRGKLTSGEIGCLLSHKAVLEMISLEDYTLILEDDVDLDEELPSFLNCIEKIQPKFDVCMLGYHSGRGKFASLRYFGRKNFGSTKVGRPVERCFGTFGYIITKQGAQKVLKDLNLICAPIDHYVACSRSLEVLVTQRLFVNICEQFDLSSNIQAERAKRPTDPSHKVMSFIKRLKIYKKLRDIFFIIYNFLQKFR